MRVNSAVRSHPSSDCVLGNRFSSRSRSTPALDTELIPKANMPLATIAKNTVRNCSGNWLGLSGNSNWRFIGQFAAF